MDKSICELSLSFELNADGLAGGRNEYRPYVESYATFGKYRVMAHDAHSASPPRKVGLGASVEPANMVDMGRDRAQRLQSSRTYNYALGDYRAMRGDAALYFKLFSHSAFSGVPEMDKARENCVELQIPSGLCQLELSKLFEYYSEELARDPTCTHILVNDNFYDHKIVSAKIGALYMEKYGAGVNITEAQGAQLQSEALHLTSKASIQFRVEFKNFKHKHYESSVFSRSDLSTYAPSNSSAAYKQLLYNAAPAREQMVATMGCIHNQYGAAFIGTDGAQSGVSASSVAPIYPACDENAQIHLFHYASENGLMPVYAYWSCHDPFYREYANEMDRARDLALYGFDARTEKHFELMMRSSLRRHGLSEKQFIGAIDEHFSPSNMAPMPSANFALAEEVLVDVGTFAANSAYYTADYRFVPTLDSLGTPHGAHRNIGERARCKKCGGVKLEVVMLDSWDNTILNNTSMCDDCEGQGNTASTIIRALAIGRASLNFSWDSALLNAAKMLLDHSVLYDVGALVSSAYMDASNNKIDLKKKELPMIGSDMDMNAQMAGHCFTLMQSLTASIDMLARGNTSSATIDRLRTLNNISAAFEKRDALRQMLTLEPTGSIEPRILPLQESYGAHPALLQRKTAERAFMKACIVTLRAMKEGGTDLTEFFIGESLAFYVETQPVEQRVSFFYRSVHHGTSVDLMQRSGDITLSQFAFCKESIEHKTGAGLRMGELLRGNPESRLSLVSPFAGQEKYWKSNVLPMVESIQNQMPIMKFGRYETREYEEEIYSRYIDPRDVVDTHFDFYDKTYAARPGARARFDAAMARVESGDGTHSVVRLYSRTWKFSAEKATDSGVAAVQRYLRAAKGLVEYGFFLEKSLPVCEPILEILCIVKTETVL